MPLLPSSKRGLGLKFEDKPSAIPTFGLDRLKLAPASAVEEFTLDEFIPEVNGNSVILDQQATNSCVLHAFIGGIHIAETMAKMPFVPCSRLFPYYNARREDTTAPIVFDNGTYLHSGAAALRKFGTPDESRWPWSQQTLTVNKRPSFDSMRYAHPRAGGQYVKIYETGDARLNAIIAALHSGHTVAFGTNVTRGFLDEFGAALVDLPSATDEIAGAHAMLIIGYKRIGARIWFHVLNSWGSIWRVGGLVWLSDTYVKWTRTQDLHIIYGWNRLREAA